MNVLTILGSGTSSGVPLIGCPCRVCTSNDPRDHRTRASAWVQVQGKSILIDTSTDLRFQALRENIQSLDAILFTHPHADHIHGIDEIRAFNFIQKKAIPTYAHDWTISEIRVRFPYIFSGQKTEGGGIPRLEIRPFDPVAESIDVEGVPVIPVLVDHGSQKTVAYRIGSVAYLTDCSNVPEAAQSRLKALDVLVLDCVRLTPHNTHFNLDQALSLVEKLNPKQTYLTHLGHEFGYEEWASKLPPGVSLAYDGLKIHFA